MSYNSIGLRTDDIIFEISKIDILLEIRMKTRIFFILNCVHVYYLKKNILNEHAITKSIHIIQRIIIDRIRRIYQLNEAIVNDN